VERVWKPPQGTVQSRVLWVLILYSFLGLPKRQKGRVGKNNTGAIGKFYELIIQQAQRLEFTTQLACFVKQEKYYFVKLLLPVI
jgi:hypothetical protein